MRELFRPLAVVLCLSVGGAVQPAAPEDSDCAQEEGGACAECCPGCTACLCCPVSAVVELGSFALLPASEVEELSSSRLEEPALKAVLADIFRPPTA